MMDSLIQWYMKKYFQGGNLWGMPTGMFPNQNTNRSNPSFDEGPGSSPPDQNIWSSMGIPPWISEMMNGMSGNSQSPFPSWIQEVMKQNGFPMGNGTPSHNPGFFGPQMGMNPLSIFQSPSGSRSQTPRPAQSRTRSKLQQTRAPYLNHSRGFQSGRR